MCEDVCACTNVPSEVNSPALYPVFLGLAPAPPEMNADLSGNKKPTKGTYSAGCLQPRKERVVHNWELCSELQYLLEKWILNWCDLNPNTSGFFLQNHKVDKAINLLLSGQFPQSQRNRFPRTHSDLPVWPPWTTPATTWTTQQTLSLSRSPFTVNKDFSLTHSLQSNAQCVYTRLTKPFALHFLSGLWSCSLPGFFFLVLPFLYGLHIAWTIACFWIMTLPTNLDLLAGAF